MAESKSSSKGDGFVAAGTSTSGGFGNLNQNLTTGLMEDADGNAVVPEIDVPEGTEIVKTHQIGAFRRTIFSNGAVETIQTEPAKPGDGTVGLPVLPGEQHDVTGTGMDADTKPKPAK